MQDLDIYKSVVNKSSKNITRPESNKFLELNVNFRIFIFTSHEHYDILYQAIFLSMR